ncbi:recombinase family protein [Methylorubrum extorquens]
MSRHSGKYVAYYRVSTDRQGKSGLGLEAQEQTVRDRLNGGDWSLVGQVTEVETGTNKRARPELDRALGLCRVMGAKLIVANVSRLTRDPDFMRKLADAGVEVEFCDLPKVEGAVGTFMLRQMLAVAELEAGMISERTKKALAQKKAWYEGLSESERQRLKEQGKATQLGGDRGNLPGVSEKGRVRSIKTRQDKAAQRAADLAPIIRTLQASGVTSASGIAKALNDRGIPTVRGGCWQAVQVRRVLSRV